MLTADDFTHWYRAHHQRLVDYASSIIRDDHAAAEDAAASAWEKAWMGRHDYQDRGKPLAWLHRLTRTAALTQIRDWRGQKPTDGHGKVGRMLSCPDVGQWLSDLPDPDNGTGLPGLASPEFAAAWDQAVKVLSPGQAQAIWLTCIDGWSNQEAARELGVGVSCVTTQVCNGLARLRRHFAGDGYVHAHGCPACGWPVRSVGHRVTCGRIQRCPAGHETKALAGVDD